MHLPYSHSELDEFLTPDGEWFYSLRSVVYDSWITWHDALPPTLEEREELDAETFKNIIQLGGSLHCFHQSVPDYRQLSQTPFNITRWWDPSDRDERWSKGRACLFSLKDYSATDLVRMIQKKTDLAVAPISKRFVEAYLPDNG